MLLSGYYVLNRCTVSFEKPMCDDSLYWCWKKISSTNTFIFYSISFFQFFLIKRKKVYPAYGINLCRKDNWNIQFHIFFLVLLSNGNIDLEKKTYFIAIHLPYCSLFRRSSNWKIEKMWKTLINILLSRKNCLHSYNVQKVNV